MSTISKLRARLTYANVMSSIAVFGVLAGGTAYAANTIGSTDIIDGQVKSVDVGDAEIKSADVKDESLTTFDVSTFLGADVVDGTLTSADIQDFSLGNGDFLTGSVDSRAVTDQSLTGTDIQNGQIGQVDLADGTVNSAKVADNSITGFDIHTGTITDSNVEDDSLRGADIKEDTLVMPPTTTATFANGSKSLSNDGTLTQIASRGSLLPGSYVAFATVNTTVSGAGITTASCELHKGDSISGPFLGGASDRRVIPSGDTVGRTLSMNGGVFIAASEFSGIVSVWCKSQSGNPEHVDSAQLMVIRVDGFF